MSNDLVKLFEVDWDTKSAIIIPEEKLEEIKSKNYDKVKIVLYGDPDSLAKNSEIDFDLYTKIKQVQGLPGEVVLRFLLSKGSVISNQFKERVNF